MNIHRFSDKDFISRKKASVTYTTREDILNLYNGYILPKKYSNHRKLPDIPQVVDVEIPEETNCFRKLKRKYTWGSTLVRFLKFLIHFGVVMLSLFFGAIVFAMIEDPLPDEKTVTVASELKHNRSYTVKDLKSGNKDILWLYLHQKYAIELNEMEKTTFLSDMGFFLRSLNASQEAEKYKKQVEDRQFIFTKWFYFATISTTTIGMNFCYIQLNLSYPNTGLSEFLVYSNNLSIRPRLINS